MLGLAAIITIIRDTSVSMEQKSEPNDSAEILQLLQNLWATGSTRQVAEGVLAATSIWGEDLNRIPGLTNMVKGFLDAIEEKGMLNVVKEIC